jgi:response regulator RpfG family c-di-GMP phosphodiesterase
LGVTPDVIVIVDDEEGIRKSLKRLLAVLDVTLLEASGGLQALELLRAHQASLIISDQRMPGMTGVELLQKVREISPDTVRILLTGYADIDATINAINNGSIRYYLNKPWDDEFLLSRITESLDVYRKTVENRHLTALTVRQNRQLEEMNRTLEKRVAEQTGQIRSQHRELLNSFMQTIKAFSTMIEIRFKDIGSHSQRVAFLAKKVLKQFNLSPKEYQDVVVGAFLHDIGKIKYPDNLLRKSHNELTAIELEIISEHPVLGQSCISAISGFEEIGAIVRHHHENYDGSGFPDKLLERRIPLGARIIRVADAFDRHAFVNGYPDVKRINNAVAHLVQNSGILYDPEVVNKFVGADIGRTLLQGPSTDIIYLKPIDLEQGMIVAADIHTKNGLFVVPKGARLSTGMIKRIIKLNERDSIPNGVAISKQHNPNEASHEEVSNLIGG